MRYKAMKKISRDLADDSHLTKDDFKEMMEQDLTREIAIRIMDNYAKDINVKTTHDMFDGYEYSLELDIYSKDEIKKNIDNVRKSLKNSGLNEYEIVNIIKTFLGYIMPEEDREYL